MDLIQKLRLELQYACTKVDEKLENIMNMKIGKLELSSKGEWVAYDPVAKAFSKHLGQVTMSGIGEVNASKPKRIGEFEFYNPNALAEYMMMPNGFVI